MDALSINNTKVGSVFPKTLPETTKNLELSYPVKDIYDRICNLYDEGNWNLDDFRKFRNLFSRKTFQETDVYGELILGILCLEPSDLDKELENLNEMYECHVLERRVQTEDKNNPYQIEKRNPNKADVVLIARDVSGRIAKYANDFMQNKITTLVEQGEDITVACGILFDELIKDENGIAQELKTTCREKFSYLANHSNYQVFYSNIEKRLVEFTIKHLKMIVARCKREETAIIDKSFILNSIAKRDGYMEKVKRGKGFGIWCD